MWPARKATGGRIRRANICRRGEYLSAYYTKDVYALYGMQGLTSETMPPVHQPEMQDVGYHIREGKHDVTDYDWERFMDFCDLHFKQK